MPVGTGMRVGFTMAPCRRLQFNLSDMYPVPRLGIAQLAALCRRLGHSVSLVDVICERWTPARFGEWVQTERLELVGVSATLLSMREAFVLCAAAKAAHPSVKTVVGGPGTGGWTPEALFEHASGAVDFFVRGEGEPALEGLLGALTRGESLAHVPGLIYRDLGTCHKNRVGPPVDLESAPGPAWDLLPMRRYRLHPPFGVYPYATLLETARGCPYPCGFCCLSAPYRARSVAWVLRQLDTLQRAHAVREVHFVDPTFTYDRERTLALCRALETRTPRLRWTCKTRVDHLDCELAGAMARAGCYGVAFGVESGADLMLEGMHKRTDTQATRRAFAACRAQGIRTIAYCLVAGPDETDQSVEATIRFVRELRADYVLYGIIDADPSNALTRRALRSERLHAADLSRFYLGEGHTTLHDTTITGVPVSTARRWLERASSDFYLRPGYAWGRIRDLRTLQDVKNLAVGGAQFAADLWGRSQRR